ncbi:MAG: hypothetical protein KBA66_07270 [Leptospiraceae bacterium]|nr:hypothetical protein [Leptospiraceae bacterium]
MSDSDCSGNSELGYCLGQILYSGIVAESAVDGLTSIILHQESIDFTE